MTQDEVLKLAKQAGLFTHKEVQPELEAFAKLVALRYEKKIADLENIICQRHWDVLQEREACAKVCDNIHAKHEAADVFSSYAEAIRARGEA